MFVLISNEQDFSTTVTLFTKLHTSRFFYDHYFHAFYVTPRLETFLYSGNFASHVTFSLEFFASPCHHELLRLDRINTCKNGVDVFWVVTESSRHFAFPTVTRRCFGLKSLPLAHHLQGLTLSLDNQNPCSSGVTVFGVVDRRSRSVRLPNVTWKHFGSNCLAMALHLQELTL